MAEQRFQAPADWALTGREAEILAALMVSRGTISKAELMAALYARNNRPDEKIIDVYVCKLRKKLAPYFSPGVLIIETVWGRGHHIPDEMKAAIWAHHTGAPVHMEHAA